MGVDITVYLNTHATAERVFDVILKVVGHEFEYIAEGNKKDIDFTAPTSKENNWYCRPIDSSHNEIELRHPEYFNLNFKDCSGNYLSTLFHLHVEEDEFNNGKFIGPRSTPIWAIVGERLVDFFGGKMMYMDDKDHDDPDNWHICENPAFPSKTIEQSHNGRIYQYYNALHNVPMITVKEINDMKEHTKYWTQAEDNLINYLIKYEAAKKLAEELQNSNKTNKTKLKV